MACARIWNETFASDLRLHTHDRLFLFDTIPNTHQKSDTVFLSFLLLAYGIAEQSQRINSPGRKFDTSGLLVQEALSGADWLRARDIDTVRRTGWWGITCTVYEWRRMMKRVTRLFNTSTLLGTP
jgi:hypothetical protein